VRCVVNFDKEKLNNNFFLDVNKQQICLSIVVMYLRESIERNGGSVKGGIYWIIKEVNIYMPLV